MKSYKKQIKNFILNKEKNKKLLGLEVEHFIVDKNNNSLYYDEIKEILSSLKGEKEYSDGNIIGVKTKDYEISLEPGCQFEIAISPKQNIEDIDTIYKNFLESLNHKLISIGYRHDACALEVPIIPKNRYTAMDARFKTIDSLGPCMMRNTASTQVSIDFNDEKDCLQKLKTATCLAPLIYFLFDNSPIFEKKKSKRMARYKVWQNTDPDRCGSIKSIFDNNFSIDTYVDEICSIPLIYARGHMKDLYNEQLVYKIGKDLFYGPYSTDEIIIGDPKLKDDEINQILTMIFYDARLKNLIELRGADSMPRQYIMSYLSLIKNIFYDNPINLFDNATYEDYREAGENLYTQGWDAKVYGYNVADLLNKLVDTDDKYLNPTKKLIDNRVVLKDYLKENFKNKESFYPISKTTKNTQKQLDFYKQNNECIQNRKLIYNNHTKSKAEYWDEIVNMGYFSKVFDKYNVAQFSDICSTLHKILSKVIAEYYENKDYQKLFNYDKFTKKLIDKRPKYSDLLPMARFDIFFDDATGKFKICEFNTGGSAAMSEVSYLCEEIKHADTYKLFDNIDTWELYDTWTEKFIKLYHEVSNKKPTIAILDFLDNCQYADFPIFKKSFEKKGYRCLICDLRELEYDGQLKWRDNQIDAVYKRVTLNDLENYKEDPGVQAFLNAVDDEKVVSIDWFSTQIVHDKQICKVLFNNKTKEILTKSEWNFIQLHMPKLYKGGSRHGYIAKPISSRGAKNIYIGDECSDAEWNKIKCNPNYLIQEYCKQYYSPNVYIDVKDKDRSLQTNSVKEFSNMEGLFCYCGKFSGIYLRQGSQKINGQKYDNIVCTTFYEK
ncbi:MAG: glutamate-cysteine ligase family protein [Coriobacteriia bacterium]|nr:glutamate-cysteine ligase family protein [Coriobacteriia bacterium]